jgi:nucleoid-associated protein YgaU
VALRTNRLSSELAGVGRGGGSLEKLTIRHEEAVAHRYTGKIVALFNPGELKFEQTVSYCEKPMAGKGLYALYNQQVFQSSSPQTLTVDLFFDSYESHDDSLSARHLGAAVLPTNPIVSAAPEAGSVTAFTEQVANLARINRELHRPPICRLQWGKFDIMRGVLTGLTQNFTMFLADGTPVRATLNCTFRQYRDDEQTLRGREAHSSDVQKLHTVRRGETLPGIAAAVYGDPRQWRPIARANGILNPLEIRPGQQLRIPRL